MGSNRTEEQEMAKLYKFNLMRNGHNIDTARTILRNRWYDANDAGDYAAAERIQARIERIDSITGACCVGVLNLPYDEWLYLHNVSEWVKTWRSETCATHGIPYVE